MDASTRSDLAAPEEMEAYVDRLVDHVRSLREHDVSPATLYALSPGSGMTAELQALAIAYEAYDRYLLESPQHDLADLCGWATAQLRTGRATWIESATIAVYDHISVSGAAASFLRALRDFAGHFEQIGAGGTGPSASVSARVATSDRMLDLDAMLNGSSTASTSSPADLGALLHDVLAEHLAADSAPSLSWVVAPGGLQQALADLRRMGWNDADMEIASGTRHNPSGPNDGQEASGIQTILLASAGYQMRDLLVIDATTAPSISSDPSAPGAPLLDASMREKIESLTGAVLPAHSADRAADLWHMAQLLWRHDGEAVFVTTDASGTVADLLGKHLDPHVLQNTGDEPAE